MYKYVYTYIQIHVNLYKYIYLYIYIYIYMCIYFIRFSDSLTLDLEAGVYTNQLVKEVKLSKGK
jgi:hypothetical protein